MATSPQLYALLVGVDRYRSPSINDLRGCVNDAKATAAFLRARLGVPEDHMRVLLSEKEDASPETLPTRANILAGWEWLLAQAQPGDQIFFQYSGHGSQAPTVDPASEPDGYDETLVPYDSRETDTQGNPVYDILDKELKTYIELVEAKGALVTVFLDCCHSGSGTRAPDVPVRKTRADERIRPLETVEPRTAARLAQPLPAPPASPSGWELGADGHVLLAGCRDEELSHEYRDPNTGAWHGATTFFLLQTLRNFDPAMTWREVYEQVRLKVNAVYQSQTPQLEGPDNRRIFGDWAPPTAPHLLVEKVEQDAQGIYVYINGGPPLGLIEGSRVEIYPPGRDGMQGPPLAQGVVDLVEVDHVWATVTTPPTDGEIPPLSRVKIAAQSYDNLVYTVAVEDAWVREILAAPRTAGAAPEEDTGYSPFLRALAEDEEGGFFRVAVQGDRYRVLDASGVQIVSETPPHSQAGARRVAEILEHLAIYSNLRNLRNPSPSPQLAEGVQVTAYSYTRAGRTAPTDGIPLDQRDAVLEPGRMVWLNVENNTGEDLYASVFVLTADFGVKRIYPRRAGYQKVEAGGGFFVNRLRPRISNPFVGRSPALFKVFVTRQPMDFDVLQMEDLNKPARPATRTRSDNPLARLLDSVRSQGTRTDFYIDDDPNDVWITKQVEFTVLAENAARELPAGQTQVDMGSPLEIRVEKPASFSGQLIASSVEQLSRGADIDAPLRLPPGLDTPEAAQVFEPLTFAGATRSTVGAPGVLALNATPEDLSRISEASPLRLELSLEEEALLEGVLPVAFDGQYYYLAGQQAEPHTAARDPSRRRLAVTITHLPLPADAPQAGGARTAGEAPTRDLKRTVRLFFYKVYRKELPADTGVRRAELAPNGAPVYTTVAPEDVAAAQRVALLVHGFTSSSEWLVQRAWPHLRHFGPYDLALTFDYETFGTAIRDNGVLLAQQLRALGFGPDDDVHLDIFCHSMGTQVVRAMVELEGGHRYVDRVFMAGAPNAGTRLAEAKKIIFWLGTVLLNQAGLAPPTLITTWFLKRFLDAAISVEDLQPDSALYQALNSQTEPLDVAYYVQIGRNEALDGLPRWEEIFSRTGLAKVFDAGLDALLGPNDLAVGVSSAQSVRNGHWPGLHVDVLPGNHFQYFYTEPSIAALRAWFQGREA